MGGSESSLTGLNNLDKFAWISAFSSGGIPEELEKDFPLRNPRSAHDPPRSVPKVP
jgi:hypothetical protein